MKQKTQSLEERISTLRAEIDAVLEAKAGEIAKECPGVPVQVILNSITRGMGCRCAVYLEVQAKAEKAA